MHGASLARSSESTAVTNCADRVNRDMEEGEIIVELARPRHPYGTIYCHKNVEKTVAVHTSMIKGMRTTQYVHSLSSCLMEFGFLQLQLFPQHACL